MFTSVYYFLRNITMCTICCTIFKLMSTIVSTFGTCCYLATDFVIMCYCRNYFLFNENLMTLRTVLTFCKTCFGTCRSLSCIYCLSMSKLFYFYCLTGELFTTHSTVNYAIIFSFCGTCCINAVFNNYVTHSVTERVDLVINIGIITYRTFIGCISTLSTCRCCFYCIVLVSKSVYYFLCYGSISTYRTLLTLGKTCPSTCRSLSCKSFLGVSERVDLVVNIGIITYRTRIGCVSVFGTSGSGYYRLIIVSKCINRYSLSANLLSAFDTIYYAIVASVIYAAGSYFIFLNRHIGNMIKLIHLNLCSADQRFADAAVNNVIIASC